MRKGRVRRGGRGAVEEEASWVALDTTVRTQGSVIWTAKPLEG